MEDDGVRMVGNGGCEAWPLPGDPTCAGIARRTYRRVAGSLSLDHELIDDGVMIVSELAANTLHVTGEAARVGPELWFYLRGGGTNRELVCKVFDAYPGWLNGAPCGHSRVPPDALSGRGLGVVHELSGGHWGYHLTRARLGGWHARGKAVWFATPVTTPDAGTAGTGTGGLPTARTASEAMAELEAGLASRGFGRTLVRADDHAADMAVLSVCKGITLWCADGAAWLRTPRATSHRMGYGDLVELTEQAVEAYETVVGGASLPQLACV
ncbi:MAG: hypothetical protein J2P25_10225 [Nocardiopsaceae bacterium]|nr:hypothetical protein [Nocardiopsaceae bacterium]